MYRITQSEAALVSTPRPFTVQCGYVAWYARIEVVEAASVEQACERAIEAANESEAWRSIDDCGPTYVDVVAEGDVDPWSAATPSVPVPLRFAEHGETQALRTALLALLDWAAATGVPQEGRWRDARLAVGAVASAAPEGE